MAKSNQNGWQTTVASQRKNEMVNETIMSSYDKKIFFY